MKRSSSREYEYLRIYIVLAVMFVCLFWLVAALWRIQVAHGSEYEDHLRRQSILVEHDGASVLSVMAPLQRSQLLV